MFAANLYFLEFVFNTYENIICNCGFFLFVYFNQLKL